MKTFTHLRIAAAAFALLVCAGAACAQTPSDPKDDLFQGTEIFARNATSVTEITMDPDSLKEVHGKDAPAARNTLLNVVRTYSYDKPGMFRMEDVDTYRNKLNTGDWHCSVHTREFKSGTSTDVCSKHRSDDYKETAIVTVSPTTLTFIHTIRKRGAGSSSWSTSGSGGSYSSDGDSTLVLEPVNGSNLASLRTEYAAISVPEMMATMQATARVNSAEMQARLGNLMEALREAKPSAALGSN